MAEQPSRMGTRCPQCHAILRAGQPNCWLCGAKTDAAAPAPATLPTHPDHPVSFSLASLMLVVTLLAVVCGVVGIAPGLGILLAIVTLPALLRTAFLIHRQNKEGVAPVLAEKASVFATSVAVVVVAGVAASLAGFAACCGGFFVGSSTIGQLFESGNYEAIGTGIITGFVLGGILGATVGYLVFLRLSPDVRKETRSRLSKVIVVVAVVVTTIAGILWFLFCFWTY